MNKIVLFSIVLLGLVAIQISSAKIIEISVSSFRGQLSGFNVDDEKVTVRTIVNAFLKEHSLPNNSKQLRAEGPLNYPYNMDKTLKDAGVKDGATLKVRMNHRVKDVILGIMDKLDN